MNALREAEKLLAAMSPAEKAALLRRVMDDLGDAAPGIESTPGVCGGAARVAGTRIAVWMLEQARRSGATDAELLTAYPTLSAGDLARAWAYVRAHGDEVDRSIRENEAA